MFLSILNKLFAREELSQNDIDFIFSTMISGNLTDIELSAFLTALKCKGETPFEIASTVNAIQKASTPFNYIHPLTCDTCGTGGDGFHTLNISTAVAFVAALGGLKTVKHGNRSVSSKSGSADVLEALGVNINCSVEQSLKAVNDLGICFLFAPKYHSGIKAAMNVRRELKTRTIFNIIGPLLNPAKPKYQLLGVYSKELCRPVAEALKMVGTKAAVVVHGSGLDEISTSETNNLSVLHENGEITDLEFHVSDIGFKPIPISELKGGTPEYNAMWFKTFLKGEAKFNENLAVAVNSGVLFWIAGKCESIQAGVELSLNLIASKKGFELLEGFKEVTNGSI